jgi:hypothetical protein
LALDHIRHEVSMMLSDVEGQLTEAAQRLAKGTLRQKVDAAGELAFLRRQKEMIETRLKQVDAAPPAATETPMRWLKEEVFNLKLRLADWTAGG